MRVFAILTGTPEGHIFAACFANSFEDNCADFRDLRVVDCFHCGIPGGIFLQESGAAEVYSIRSGAETCE